MLLPFSVLFDSPCVLTPRIVCDSFCAMREVAQQPTSYITASVSTARRDAPSSSCMCEGVRMRAYPAIRARSTPAQSVRLWDDLATLSAVQRERRRGGTRQINPRLDRPPAPRGPDLAGSRKKEIGAMTPICFSRGRGRHWAGRGRVVLALALFAPGPVVILDCRTVWCRLRARSCTTPRSPSSTPAPSTPWT